MNHKNPICVCVCVHIDEVMVISDSEEEEVVILNEEAQWVKLLNLSSYIKVEAKHTNILQLIKCDIILF